MKMEIRQYYQVKGGQTLRDIAEAFCVSERLLIQENRLQGEVFAGQILRIPAERGNSFTVQAGQNKSLLCGSEENYRKKNGTDILYIGMRVIL